MLIRRGQITDVYEVSRLWLDMVKESNEPADPDVNMWRGWTASLMQTPAYYMFVAEEDNRIVGFIDFTIMPEPGRSTWKAMGGAFYVVPKSRGGIATKKLWESFSDTAKKSNATELHGFCFPERFEFWKKHGFNVEGIVIRKVL